MKYTVGLQYVNDNFIDEILRNKEHIYEVYFSWGDFPNGRSGAVESETYSPIELQERQVHILKELSENGIKLNLLFNANCYGGQSLSRWLFEKIGDTTDYISQRFGLSSVTTTSPIIAKFIKNNFPSVETRASVNMEIGTVQGMDYLSEYFDSFYMKRELNRDFEAIKCLSDWCKDNNKKLYMLANSGCLNHCSAHNFHDNLVAHELEIVKMDNAYNFTGICKEYLKNKDHYKSLIEDTNFVRPEDIYKYEPYFEAVKLATRVHRNPVEVLRAYINQQCLGNILRLLEPEHNIYPYIVENGDPLKIVKLEV